MTATKGYFTKHRVALAWAAALTGGLIAAASLYIEGSNILPADAVACARDDGNLASEIHMASSDYALGSRPR